MPYYLYIHNIYLYQYHDTKSNSINIDWLLGLTPTWLWCCFVVCIYLCWPTACWFLLFSIVEVPPDVHVLTGM